MEKKYDVYGIGNPLIDLLSFISDDVLTELGRRFGTSGLVEKANRTD